MCRLLLLHDPAGLDPNPALDHFRRLSRDSSEYQGHGWGCAWLDANGAWAFHHDIRPVWEDERRDFPDTTLYLAHARSAFRNEGIEVANNMPFSDGRSVFAFNGELHGVRVRSQGRIGAEKIFNYIRRFDRGDMAQAFRRGIDIIHQRTRYVRAMNIILATTGSVHVHSFFNEDPDYFRMHSRIEGGTLMICSERFPADAATDWTPLDNRSYLDIPLFGGTSC